MSVVGTDTTLRLLCFRYALQLLYCVPGVEVKWLRRKFIATAAPLSAAYIAIACDRSLVVVFRLDWVLTTVRLPRVASADITISASSSELPRWRSRGGRGADIRSDCNGVP